MWKKRALELKMCGLKPIDIYKKLKQEGFSPNYNSMRRYINPNNHKEIEISEVKSLHETVLQHLSAEKTVEELSKITNKSARMITAIIDDLREQGYNISEYSNKIKLDKETIPQDSVYTEDWQGNRIFRFGVVSDPHIGSKYAQYTQLHELFDIFKHEGIPKVYCPGDMSEGWKMRPGHEHEVHAYGADEQVDWITRVWPNNGIATEFILGNHDQSHIKNGNINIGIQIHAKRSDMKYLGVLNAKVFITPNCSIELNHPLDGASYALSYAPQKTIDAMFGGEKPSILLNGHHHKAFFLFYRNIHALECATTQAQTIWMRGKRIAANMGGFIVTVHVDSEGTVKRFMPEYIPYYDAIPEDWKNWR